MFEASVLVDLNLLEWHIPHHERISHSNFPALALAPKTETDPNKKADKASQAAQVVGTVIIEYNAADFQNLMLVSLKIGQLIILEKEGTI